jgi:hypothetical protein
MEPEVNGVQPAVLPDNVPAVADERDRQPGALPRVDRDSPVPLAEQVALILRSAIQSGQLHGG